MKLSSNSMANGQPISGKYAFGVPADEGHVSLSSNLNPHLAWADLPAGTKSLVLICHDKDVPSKGDDVNQEGKTVPPDLPRVDFFHWVLLISTLPAVKSGKASIRAKSPPRANPAPPRPKALARASTTTPTGSLATPTWAETTTAMTAPARRGTTASSTTTSLRCTQPTWTRFRSRGALPARTFATRSPLTRWHLPA